VRIYADNRRYAKYAAICSATGLLGVLVARSTLAIGAPVAVIFFGLTAFLVRGAVSRAPQITVAEDGLGGEQLPRQLSWAEIDSIAHTTRTARYSKIELLRISAHDGAVFELSLSSMLTPPSAIVEEVKRFHPVG